jgi:hypothetical protein
MVDDMTISNKTLAIMQAMQQPEAPNPFPALRTKATPEATKQPTAKLPEIDMPHPQCAPDCEPHAGMAEAPAPTINPVTVTPICDTGPLVAENIRLGFQMAIDMLAAVNAIQNGTAVPAASQFTGNRLP